MDEAGSAVVQISVGVSVGIDAVEQGTGEVVGAEVCEVAGG